MIEAAGHRLPEDVADSIRLGSALVVWDMQEAICRRAHDADAVIGSVCRLLGAARANGVPVIYSQHVSMPWAFEDAAWMTRVWNGAGRPDPATLPLLAPRGSDAGRIVHELTPEAGDLVLEKTRPNFFVDTPLVRVLRALEVQALVLTGVASDQGVLSTAQHAAVSGYFPVTVDSASGSFTPEAHETGLAGLRSVGAVTDAQTVIDAWMAGTP